MRYSELEFRRLAVWGGGREGHTAIHVLRERFPDKMLTWIVPAGELSESRASAPDGIILAAEGEPDAELSGYEVILKSPGISSYRPDVLVAKARGTQFTSGSAIWFAEHPGASTICITGTKGKSTTSALIAHLLRAAGIQVGFAGNIGMPLLALDAQRPADWYVFELSSFQTADLDCAPTVAVLTSLAEEHLDWHGDVERYRSDKLRLFRNAVRAVLPARMELPVPTRGEVVRFGSEGRWHVAEGHLFRGPHKVMPLRELPLRGRHNYINLCAALVAIEAAGFDAHKLLRHVDSFQPLPHRLQELGLRDGVLYVNDSIATTPAATLAAWDCYRSQPLALILGGFDRGLDWNSAVAALGTHKPRMILTQGESGPRIAGLMRAAGIGVVECRDLKAAVSMARLAVSNGGVVLLSPGAPSYPVFRDYTERGRCFAAAAGFDPNFIASIDGLGVH